MATPFVIVGAGGLAREAFDVWRSASGALDFAGFVSTPEPPHDLLSPLGAAWLGPEEYVHELPSDVAYIVAIGDSSVRRRIDTALLDAGRSCVTLIHPTAVIGSDVHIGPGAIIPAHCTVTTHVHLGRGAVLNPGVVLTHDVVVGDYVTIGPNSAVCGRATIGADCLIGAGSTIAPDVRVGEASVIGAGSVVIADVPSHQTVAGNPARSLHN